MLLRDVELGDLSAYIALRCDPAMTVYLGGPRPRAEMQAKLERDVADVQAGRAEICMIVADASGSSRVAGTVTLWSHQVNGAMISEIGWMVLAEFQGRGLAKRAVGELLSRVAVDRRWGGVHAFPSADNAASNGLCRSLGFTLLGAESVDYRGRAITANHWLIHPSPPPREASDEEADLT